MVLFGSVPVDKTFFQDDRFKIVTFLILNIVSNTEGANKISPNLRRLKNHEEESEEFRYARLGGFLSNQNRISISNLS